MVQCIYSKKPKKIERGIQMKKQTSDFLMNLEIGDRVIIVEGDYNILEEELSTHEIYTFGTARKMYEPFIGQIAKVINIDIDWQYPIEVEFEDEVLQDMFKKLYPFDLWHETQIEWY